MKQFKVVPFHAVVAASEEPVAAAASQLQVLVDAHAEKKWLFKGVYPLSLEQRPGCLGALLGGKARSAEINVVVFESE